jgi:hypothetical protein
MRGQRCKGVSRKRAWTLDSLEATRFNLKASPDELEEPPFELVAPHFHGDGRQDVLVERHFAVEARRFVFDLQRCLFESPLFE